MDATIKTPRRLVTLLVIAAILLAPTGLRAWSEHPLITDPVVAALPAIAGAGPVAAEPIAVFLADTAAGLEKLLADEERWAQGHLDWYPPLPTGLAFQASGDPAGLLTRFCQAIRINPRVRFPLYLQSAGAAVPSGPALRPAEISFLSDLSDWGQTAFVAVAAGEKVLPREVVVSASDEPDLLGLDIGLFADNGTDFGKRYGLGAQPFGNPNLEYGSQAPFHMGFYHESGILYAFAGFLKQTLPEYRIHLYRNLARFAFATGHPYWGWRFAGIGLHYLADLAQPYHATVLPGVGTAYALWINTIDLLGIHGPKNDAVQLVSNRHTALEKFVQVILQRAIRQGDKAHPVLAALANAPEGQPYADDTPRGVVARLAHSRAEETDRILAADMPAKFVSDPAFEIGTSPEREQIVERVEQEKGRAAAERLTLLARDLLVPFATHGRAYLQSILEDAKAAR